MKGQVHPESSWSLFPWTVFSAPGSLVVLRHLAQDFSIILLKQRAGRKAPESRSTVALKPTWVRVVSVALLG